ncbi:hypothetical protein [Amycolatopsis sp. FDAARGOS 1241]|nr:hypothetical protein [Amycolatopsis sp. FDAARGOS 1241]QRP48016.1 hypothetical protein I6J71_09070 [Amycolatopsis sp. FDAARGOS 1241]
MVWIASLAGWHLDADTAVLVIGIGSTLLGTTAVVRAKPNDPQKRS